MLNFEFTKINLDNSDLIKDFINNAGNSLSHFRYFNKRPISIIKNHIITYLIITNNIPICYGHLDKDEEGKIWLGICVIEKMMGRGFGTLMIQKLLDFAKIQDIKQIFLSVDKNNLTAQGLYEKFKFQIVENNENYFIYSLDLEDLQ